jgi:hypothetical protein
VFARQSQRLLLMLGKLLLFSRRAPRVAIRDLTPSSFSVRHTVGGASVAKRHPGIVVALMRESPAPPPDRSRRTSFPVKPGVVDFRRHIPGGERIFASFDPRHLAIPSIREGGKLCRRGVSSECHPCPVSSQICGATQNCLCCGTSRTELIPRRTMFSRSLIMLVRLPVLGRYAYMSVLMWRLPRST